MQIPEIINTVKARFHKVIFAVQDSSTTFWEEEKFPEFLPPTEICRSVYYEHRFAFLQFNEFLTEISEKDFSTQISAALNDFSHEAERIYSFHNANPQFFKITNRHNIFPVFRLLSRVF